MLGNCFGSVSTQMCLLIKEERLTAKHIRVGIVSNGVQMWRDFRTFLATVHHDYLHRIDGQTFERVDDDAEKTRIGLNFFLCKIYRSIDLSLLFIFYSVISWNL